MATKIASLTNAIVDVQAEMMARSFDEARSFFKIKPMSHPVLRDAVPAAAPVAPPPTLPEPPTSSSDGTVQFHLIGMKPTDPKWGDIMNENADLCLNVGSLIHGAMNQYYPSVSADKLSFDNWAGAISNLPGVSLSKAVDKNFSQRVDSVNISGAFLSLLAKAIITDGSSLLTDFDKFLQIVGDDIFKKTSKDQGYKLICTTFTNYLIDNQTGSYYDYATVGVKEVTFNDHFQELKVVCATVTQVDVSMTYKESIAILPTRLMRKGGAHYEDYQQLFDENWKAQFKVAKNFFHPAPAPQSDIKPIGM